MTVGRMLEIKFSFINKQFDGKSVGSAGTIPVEKTLQGAFS